MPLPTESQPQAVIEAFFTLLETAPQLFDDQDIEALSELQAQSTDSDEEIAKRIEKWCESRPQIYENMENEFLEMGAGDTDSEQKNEEAARKLNERLKENQERLGSKNSSSTQNNDSRKAN
ncbi:MAG: hypothetical protein RMY36_003300 [Nostoc sp. SerVER01]|nr:hypothetical protein [Nostoc sp. SerVER01]